MGAKVFIRILLLAWLGFTANASGAPLICVPESDPATPTDTVCTATRDVTVYFGTLSIVGAALPAQDFVEFTDRISDGARSFLVIDPLVDPRVRSAAPSLVIPGITNIEWILGAPDNFPAQQNLLDDFAAAAAALDSLFGPGTLTFSSAVLGYMPTYLLDEFMDCPGQPNCQNPTRENLFYGRFSLFEQNAVYTVAGTSIVPEPATYALFGIGLLGLGWLRRKRV